MRCQPLPSHDGFDEFDGATTPNRRTYPLGYPQRREIPCKSGRVCLLHARAHMCSNACTPRFKHRSREGARTLLSVTLLECFLIHLSLYSWDYRLLSYFTVPAFYCHLSLLCFVCFDCVFRLLCLRHVCECFRCVFCPANSRCHQIDGMETPIQPSSALAPAASAAYATPQHDSTCAPAPSHGAVRCESAPGDTPSPGPRTRL